MKELFKISKDQRAAQQNFGYAYILIRQGIYELWQYFVSDNSFRKVFTVVRQPAKRKGCRLLNARNIIQEKRSQQLHHSGIVHDFDILRSGSRLRNSLHELHARLLILLKVL